MCLDKLIPRRSPLDFMAYRKRLCPWCLQMEMMDLQEGVISSCDHAWSQWVGGPGGWIRSCHRCAYCHIAHTEDAPPDPHDLDISWAPDSWNLPSKERP